MNSDQLPPAKPWGPSCRGVGAGNHPLGCWDPSWEAGAGSGAKAGWPQLQVLPGSKSMNHAWLSTMNQLPWLAASAWAKRLDGNIPLIREHIQLYHHNTCTTTASLRLLPYRLKIHNVKKTKEEINLKSSWWCQLMCPPIQKKIIYTSYKECLQTLSLMCTPYQHALILYTSFNLNSFDFLSGRQKRTLIAIAYWIYRVVH